MWISIRPMRMQLRSTRGWIKRNILELKFSHSSPSSISSRYSPTATLVPVNFFFHFFNLNKLSVIFPSTPSSLNRGDSNASCISFLLSLSLAIVGACVCDPNHSTSTFLQQIIKFPISTSFVLEQKKFLKIVNDFVVKLKSSTHKPEAIKRARFNGSLVRQQSYGVS